MISPIPCDQEPLSVRGPLVVPRVVPREVPVPLPRAESGWLPSPTTREFEPGREETSPREDTSPREEFVEEPGLLPLIDLLLFPM